MTTNEPTHKIDFMQVHELAKFLTFAELQDLEVKLSEPLGYDYISIPCGCEEIDEWDEEDGIEADPFGEKQNALAATVAEMLGDWIMTDPDDGSGRILLFSPEADWSEYPKRIN